MQCITPLNQWLNYAGILDFPEIASFPERENCSGTIISGYMVLCLEMASYVHYDEANKKYLLCVFTAPKDFKRRN